LDHKRKAQSEQENRGPPAAQMPSTCLGNPGEERKVDPGDESDLLVGRTVLSSEL